MDNSFTHILCIKVWSPYLKITTNNGNIESLIKDYILKTNIHFISEINDKSIDKIVNWRIKKFEEPYDKMFSGDLVANVPDNFDDKIYKSTKEILQEIEEQLKNEEKITKEKKLLFTIVKNII